MECWGIEQWMIHHRKQVESGGLRSKRRKGLVAGVVDLLQRLHRAITAVVGWIAGDAIRRSRVSRRGRFGRRRRSAATVGIGRCIDRNRRDGSIHCVGGRIAVAAQGAAAQQRRPYSRERRNKHPKWLARYRHIKPTGSPMRRAIDSLYPTQPRVGIFPKMKKRARVLLDCPLLLSTTDRLVTSSRGAGR